jgi:hypothetical protein
MDLDLAVRETRPAVPGEDFDFTTTETDAAFLVLAHLPGKHVFGLRMLQRSLPAGC